MSTITIPTDIGAVSSEVAANRKAAGDPDAKLANAIVALAGQAKTDIEALEGGGGGDPAPPTVVNLAALTGGGTIDEVTIFEAGDTARAVTKLLIRPSDSVVANDSSYAAFEFFLRTSAGAQSATIAIGTTVTEGTGDIDPFERYAVDVEWTVAAGGCITMTATSISNGTFPRAAYGVF